MSARMYECPVCGPCIQDDADSICCPSCGNYHPSAESPPIGSERSGEGNPATDEPPTLSSAKRADHETIAELLEALKLADALLGGANMNTRAVERKVREAIANAEASS